MVEAPKLRLIDRDRTHNYGDFLALDNNGDLIFTIGIQLYPSNQNYTVWILILRQKQLLQTKYTWNGYY